MFFCNFFTYKSNSVTNKYRKLKFCCWYRFAQTVCINTPITSITYTTTGATGASFAGLPTGVTGSWSGNVVTISGTPSTAGGTYTITLMGGCGSVTKTGTITVTPVKTIALISVAGTDSQTVCINTPITSITYTTTGATGASFAGLPTGVTGSWSGNVVTISGTPSTAGGTYTITLMGGCGSMNATGTITVTTANTAGVASSSPTVCMNTAIPNVTIATTGATGIGAATGLPGGVNAVWTSNTITISGTPTSSGTFNYSIPLTGGCGTTNATGTMTVNALPAATVSAANNQICSNENAGFTIAGPPNASVQYQINGGSVNTLILNASGQGAVTVSNATSNQIFTVVSVSNGICSGTGNSATVTVGEDSVYTGTWSKGLPNGNGLNAVIAGNYNTSAGDIKACSCTILSGGSLTVGANHFLEVDNAVTNNGTLIVESDGNLIQNVDSPSPANSGNITVKRNIKFRNDSRQEYNYLISPVIGQSLKTIYPGVPTTATYPYVLYYNEANNYFYNSSGAYIAGRGLAVKEPSKADAPADNMDAVFNGLPGNGVISFPLAHTNNVQNGYNLVGNPYPSNIDLQKLYLLNGGATASPKISSTFQFWDNGANNIYTQQGSGYNGRAYAAYNAVNDTGNKAGYLLDSNPANAIGAKEPNKTAKVGQGFMVRATGGGNLVFNNDIRSNNTGAGFFSKGTQSPADRYWLKLVTPVNAVNTIAVVYFAGGSNAFGMDDSGMNGDSSDMLYSLAEGNKLQIEGKPMFEVSDKIILGSRHFAAGNYTFTLDKAEGVFANGQHIYLKDKQTGIITNLSEGSYTFAANAGESTGRFEIIYQSETVLATDGTVKDDLLVYRDGDDFVIDSKGKKITQVEVYDSSGRLSLKTEPGSMKTVIPAVSLSNGVYILKINQAGKITNRKIIR
ncbi:T9SS type A sorting domain-containing protein [Kaistella sp. DKR-2]|nr:T9SS type A sorting domain-containing protein [Kaistella soli]